MGKLRVRNPRRWWAEKRAFERWVRVHVLEDLTAARWDELAGIEDKRSREYLEALSAYWLTMDHLMEAGEAYYKQVGATYHRDTIKLPGSLVSLG